MALTKVFCITSNTYEKTDVCIHLIGTHIKTCSDRAVPPRVQGRAAKECDACEAGSSRPHAGGLAAFEPT